MSTADVATMGIQGHTARPRPWKIKESPTRRVIPSGFLRAAMVTQNPPTSAQSSRLSSSPSDEHLTQYAVRCMTEWIPEWSINGWINAAGGPVANINLVKEASELADQLRDFRRISYIWIPREENQAVDRACNREMDRMAEDARMAI